MESACVLCLFYLFWYRQIDETRILVETLTEYKRKEIHGSFLSLLLLSEMERDGIKQELMLILLGKRIKAIK